MSEPFNHTHNNIPTNPDSLHPVIFIDGEENKLTIESEWEKASPILRKQYLKAHEIYKKLFGLNENYKSVGNQKPTGGTSTTLQYNNLNNIIAFCGDRGTGKTSCMESFRAQINDKDNNVLILDTIDPSFFDDNHNILQLILGQIYKSLQRDCANPERKNHWEFNYSERVLIELNKAISYLKYLARPENTPNHYDGMEELEYLAAGINLQETISSVINAFLAFNNKERLIISIDDIDLNTTDAYIMAEHIRKYLTVANCVVLLSVNVDQFTDIIKIQMEERKALKTESYNMAVKYVTKFIPLGNRVYMPNLEDYCNMTMIYRIGNQDIKFNSIKEAVTLLIFWKTGYLFYNSKGGSSLIVPRSLRQLRQLFHLLAPLCDIYDKVDNDKLNKIPIDVLRDNQTVFKNYFYYTWTKMFEDAYRTRVNKIITQEHHIMVNKTIVSILNEIGSLSNNEDFKDICDSAAYAYNISLGDVMRLVEYLSRDESDNQLQAFLFFIRSYYSMLLYDAYDDRIHDLYQPAKEENNNNKNKGEIYVSDPLFNSINNLQQIVNGQYFSYKTADYLAPHEKSEDDNDPTKNVLRGIDIRFIGRDKRLINGGVLFQELNRIIKSDVEGEITEEDKKNFNVIEYFILAVSRGLRLKSRNARWKKNRNSTIPVHLSLNGARTHLVFDVLAPFFNVLNLKTTYDRFNIPSLRQDKDGLSNPSLFEYAYEKNWTLLYKLLMRNKDDIHKDMEGAHTFIKDSAIRNVEILSAIGETLKVLRLKPRTACDKTHIEEFYKDLMNLGMQVYPDKNKEPNTTIEFKFLSEICEALKNCDKTYFDEIFNSGLMFEYDAPAPAAIFTKKTYKHTTIVTLLKEVYPDIYKQMKLKDWTAHFPKNTEIPSGEIIDFIEKLLTDKF